MIINNLLCLNSFSPMRIQQQQIQRTVCHFFCIFFYLSLSLSLSLCLFVSVYRFIARKTGFFPPPLKENSLQIHSGILLFVFVTIHLFWFLHQDTFFIIIIFRNTWNLLISLVLTVQFYFYIIIFCEYRIWSYRIH